MTPGIAITSIICFTLLLIALSDIIFGGKR